MRHKKKRRLAVAAVVISLLIAMMGCTPSTNEQSSSNSAEGNQNQDAKTTAPETVSGTVQTNAVKMKPGTYSAESMGFSLVRPLTVEVTVDETSILKIEVGGDDGETDSIRDDTVKLLVPRMLEYQSVAIDSITGATATSSAIKAGAADAITKALEAGGSSPESISAFENVPEKSTATETLNVDILIVGMGNSGLFASLSAAENMYNAMGEDSSKVNVLAIDKAGRISGTGAVTGDVMAVNAPRMKEELNGGEDWVNVDEFKAAWMEYCHNDPKEEILDMFLAESGEALDWAHYDHGFTVGEPSTGFGPDDIFVIKHQAPNGHAYGNYKAELAELHYKLLDDYEKYGGKYLLETEAYELLCDDETGAVVGVKARNDDGTEYIIHAKSVILATGGFFANSEMEEKYLSDTYFPLKGTWKMWGMRQNDGKMVQQAIDINAGTYNIGMPPMIHVAGSPRLLTKYPVNLIEGEIDIWTGKTATWSLNDVPIIMTTATNTLQLDKQGNRFSNEAGVFGWWMAGPTFYTIWSEDQVKEIKETGFRQTVASPFIGQGGIPVGQPVPEIYDVIQECIDLGIAYKAESIKDAAAVTGMDADNLKNALETYNEACRSANDMEFGKPAEYLDAIGDGPYYIFEGASYAYSTCGALDINPRLQVVSDDGTTPIPGLYAVGNDSMGTLYSERAAYVSYGGAAMGWCLTSGKIAGETVVEDVIGE